MQINETIQRSELESALKSRLHSRMIPFSAYYMSDGSAVIIISLRSDRFSVDVPYLITEDYGNLIAVTPNQQFETTSVNEAVGKIIIDVRRIEVRFHKWKK